MWFIKNVVKLLINSCLLLIVSSILFSVEKLSVNNKVIKVWFCNWLCVFNIIIINILIGKVLKSVSKGWGSDGCKSSKVM